MRHAVSLLLVFAGGAAGVLLRVGVFALPLGLTDPFAMLVINIIGALMLGVVATTLRSARARLLFGTGLLGGFTSYSAMILLAMPGAASATPWLGLTLAAATVVAGTVAAAAGSRLGSRLRPGLRLSSNLTEQDRTAALPARGDA